ncbi:glycogen synthase [Escherichia coli]|uniref:starch synthase n=1 Tax=Escherichia coli TaxID=562 RepID=A0A2X1N3W3_ECOLX|nr:glycogen synthase [Escherichia coli]
MQVLHVCSEMFPLLKTGGLADVIGALPAAQIADGVDARVLLPAFPDIRRGVTDAQVVSRRDTFAGHITLLFGHYNGVGIYLIDAPHLYDRPGSPYHDTNLFAYTDNVLRFALLGGLGQKWPAVLTHSGVLMWCMRTTACRSCACVFGGARASCEVGVYCAQPGLSRHVLCTSHE